MRAHEVAAIVRYPGEWWTYAVVVVTGFVGSGYFLALALGAKLEPEDEETSPKKLRHPKKEEIFETE